MDIEAQINQNNKWVDHLINVTKAFLKILIKK